MDRLQRFVLTADAFVSLVSGLVLFFAPSQVGDLILLRKTDGVHWHLIRCVGGQIISLAYFFYRLRYRATETKTTCYIVRIFSSILCIFLFYNAISVHKNAFNLFILRIFINSCFGTLALYVLLLLASGWKLGSTLYAQNRVGNILYQLDTIASITVGMAWMSHPQWLLHRQVQVPMDESHELCGRMMGALFVASQTISAHALHWKNHSDRLMAAEARTVCCLFMLAAQIWSQVAYEKHWSGSHWVGISLNTSWTMIALTYRIYTFFTGPEVAQSKQKVK
ncbi:hypothetical protein Ddc_13716 [Ditylenchus destructor]|nr:hypothetical protein Ddc_13716 [Ditylenchus destructor]